MDIAEILRISLKAMRDIKLVGRPQIAMTADALKKLIAEENGEDLRLRRDGRYEFCGCEIDIIFDYPPCTVIVS